MQENKKFLDYSFYVGMIFCLIYNCNLIFEANFLKIPISTLEFILALIITPYYIYFGHKRNIRFFVAEAFDKKINTDLYFHGFRIWHYLYAGAFIRIEDWNKSRMHYELSALAMMSLLKFRSARICHGSVYDEDNNFKTDHAWVEFRIPLCGWWVADFSKIPDGYAPRKQYFDKILEEGLHVEYDIKAKARDYKRNDKIKQIRKAMQNANTSNVFLELSAFTNPNCKVKPKEPDEKNPLGAKMPPIFLNNKPFSTEIIQDFVKKNNRHQPTKRSLRKTYSMMRKDPR